MNNQSNTRSNLTTGNLVVSIIILIAFFVFPFIGVYSVATVTAGNAVFKLRDASDFFSMSPDAQSSFINFSMLFLVYYAILGTQIWSLLKYFKQDYEGFNKAARISYITTFLLLALTWLIKTVIMIQVKAEMEDSLYGYSSMLDDLISLKSGFWIMFLCSIIGYFLPSLTGQVSSSQSQSTTTSQSPKPQTQVKLSQATESVSENMKNLLNYGKSYVADKAAAIKARPNEDTADLLPVITLAGDNQTLNISNLPATLGRNRSEVDVYLFDNTISRNHCEILYYDNSVLISDSGSVYGTYINGEKLEPHEYYEVFDGDKIKFGDLEFTAKLNELLLNTKYNQNKDQTPIETSESETVAIYSDKMDGGPVEEITEQNNYEQDYIREANPDFVPRENFDYDKTIKLDGPQNPRPDFDYDKTIKLDDDF